MKLMNSTLESGFILVGILDGSGSPELICATITALYMLALTSNGLLLLVITLDARLHVPMYLLLRQLSLIDLLFTSTVTPKAILACVDTSQYELMVYVTGVIFLLLPLSAIFTSYSLILSTVLHMPSNEGRKKALVTCSSHLTVVGMFYGGATFMYVLPSSFHSSKQDNIISVFYTIVTPALNPLIYSLRNK
ncbi:hypothetical protein A6R68_05904, partial [Neotoma lepida]